MTDILKRISGVVLIVIAVVVAIYTIVEPLLHVSSEEQMYGPLLGHFKSVDGAGSGARGDIQLHPHRKRGVGSERRQRGDYARVPCRQHAVLRFLFLGILLLWSWFNKLSPEYTPVGEDASTLVWILIDATLPLLSGAMGLFLLRGGSNNE